MKKKVLVLGGKGMLGHKLVQVLDENVDVYATFRETYVAGLFEHLYSSGRIFEQVEIRDLEQTRKVIEKVRPDVIVNAIGVVKQIPTADDIESTLYVNSIFPHKLASLCEEFDIRLVLISTDCVFSGKRGNYSEIDLPDPVDLYGRSKHLGEVTDGRVITLRTSIIGREVGTRHGLLEWLLSQKGKPVAGYQNAIFSGFPTIVFADIIASLISDWSNISGLFHVSSEPIDKCSLLELLNDGFQAQTIVNPVNEPVIDRSLDSNKFRAATGFIPPTWTDMIKKMLEDPTPYDKWH